MAKKGRKAAYGAQVPISFFFSDDDDESEEKDKDAGE